MKAVTKGGRLADRQADVDRHAGRLIGRQVGRPDCMEAGRKADREAG
jgi:hypothetical protein